MARLRDGNGPLGARLDILNLAQQTIHDDFGADTESCL